MTCVLPVFAGDVFLLFNLLTWIKQLGGCRGHDALIVADAATPFNHCLTAAKLAADSFDSVQIITNGTSVPGWVPGSNSLFFAACEYCRNNPAPHWLWLEPDCVPLKPGWLDALNQAYLDSRKPFMAAHYPCSQAGLPSTMITGIGVYPGSTAAFYAIGPQAFDIQLSRTLRLADVEDTKLIQHFWGLPGLPPTFRADPAYAPLHAFTLDKLDPRAVLFHRQKDGTLLDLLRRRAGIVPPPPLVVVLPVCPKDVDLMIKCLEWAIVLDGRNQFDCLIAHDPSLNGTALDRIRSVAARAFKQVLEFSYPRPPRETWPDACNIAFQSTAQHMQAVHHRPWLWFEADCVPLKPDWLPMLWQEYQFAGQPIMGPVIEGCGHMNGTGIYPANFATLSPRAMSAGELAWDTSMTPDLVGKTHDCSRLWCHRWGNVNGQLHQSQGPPPHFPNVESVRLWIPPEAVLFHRCKDGSLIDQLRAKKRA